MQLESQLDCADRAMPRPVARTFRGLEGLDEVSGAWGVLIRDAGSPMQHPIWVRACIEAFGTGAEFQATVVGPARQVTAIAPLLRRRNGLGYLEVPGVAVLREPTDLIYADPSALASLARALAGLGCAVYLKRVPVDSPTLAALRDAYRGRGVVTGRPADACPAIALDATWEEPERQFNAGRRSDLRRTGATRRGSARSAVRCCPPPRRNWGRCSMRRFRWRRPAGRGSGGVPWPSTRRAGASTGGMPPPPPARASSACASCGSAGGPWRCSSRSSVVRGSGC